MKNREILAPPPQGGSINYDVIAGVYSSVMPRKVEKREPVPEQSEQVQQENEVANATGRGLGVMLDFRWPCNLCSYT